MEYIYARCSTDRQETQNQVSALKAMHPEAIVYEETASGAKARPILATLLTHLKTGDVLIISALDRIGRRTAEVLTLLESLDKRGVIVKSIREGVDMRTIAGKLVMQILASVAEMERSVIADRIKTALAAKRLQGIVGGRRPTFNADTVAKVRELKAQGMTCKAIAAATGVSASRVSQLTKALKLKTKASAAA